MPYTLDRPLKVPGSPGPKTELSQVDRGAITVPDADRQGIRVKARPTEEERLVASVVGGVSSLSAFWVIGEELVIAIVEQRWCC